jgi:ubiquinone/menaquinone biosynthesis C-methylase UbiE
MLLDFSRRAETTEIMDDLSRPDEEFAAAYRELAIINRWLGGVRAIRRFLPEADSLSILDVAAGAADVSEAILRDRRCRIVALDLNLRGLRLVRQSLPVQGDALQLPFPDSAFDVVTASLFFHHLSNADCARALTEMWRVARRLVLVNDLHRTRTAYYSIRGLTAVFSGSRMVRHDGPVSVLRAFKPNELMQIAGAAGIRAEVHRSFPYRLVLIAGKQRHRCQGVAVGQ